MPLIKPNTGDDTRYNALSKTYKGGNVNTTYTQVINVTGKGTLNSITSYGSQSGVSAGVLARITIDGVEVVSDLNCFNGSSRLNTTLNFVYKNSLIVELKRSNTDPTSSHDVHYTIGY